MRRVRPIAWVGGIVVVGWALTRAPAPAQAWNPLKAAANGLSAAGRAIGRVLGAPAGGFVEAASTPTIHGLEDAGHHLIADADTALGHQIDRAGSVAGKLVGRTDQVLADRLDQVDRSLEARIVQVHATADELVDRSFGRLDHSIGLLDGVARRRIAQIGKTGHDLIAQADASATKVLAQADEVLARRTEDVRRLVSTSIQQADQAAAARIEQLDEVAGRRLGNLDVIATKQSLGLEGMLLRLAALVGMLAFLAFALWRLFVELGRAWRGADAEARGHRRVIHTVRHGGSRFAIQVAFAAVGAGLLYVMSGLLPRDAQKRAEAQRAAHEAAFEAALHAYDFTSVRYHEAQLEILAPNLAATYRGEEAKAELLRSVFTRPAQLESLEGIRGVVAEVDRVSAMVGGSDPDLLVVEGYVLWQVGSERADEYEAASLCATALQEADKAGAARDFQLAPLARNYLRAFLHDPYQPPAGGKGPSVSDLRTVLGRAGRDAAVPAFAHVIEYDRLVAALDQASTAAYLDMLSAQADLVVARSRLARRAPDDDATRAARTRRNQAAARVVDAWRTFDQGLAGSPWLADDPSALSAFTLDDAVLSRALYFTAVPDADDLAPELSDPKAKIDPRVRVEMAPLRVAWERRYAPLIGDAARDLLAYQEAQRFDAFEQRDAAFERAYVAFEAATRGGPAPVTGDLADAAIAAADAAADIGLYRGAGNGGATPLAQVILDELGRAGGRTVSADVRSRVMAGYQQRRLRFL